MTYCCGILVRDGLVMIADTRTNAGLDNVSTFRKLHIFTKPGERIMAIASAGNLAISQSVLSTLTEGLEDPNTGEIETLINAPTMFQAAQRIVAVTYEPLILYIEVALIYLVLSTCLSWLQTLLERRLGRYGGYLEARA